MTPEEQAAADKAAADKTVADGKAAADQAAADAKAADDKKAADEKATADKKAADEKAAADAKNKAPETYALVAPEGGHVSAADVKDVETRARAAGWTNEQAQAVVTELDAQYARQSDRFLAETTADPTYGGAKLDETKRLAAVALDRLRAKGTPRGDAFRALLERGGYGNHLEVVALLADIGKLMDEDRGVYGRGGGGSGDRDNSEEARLARLYPTHAPKS
jgi:hypothetical protein